MISGIAFTKTRMLAESESPLSLKTSTVTSKVPDSSKTWLIMPCFVVFVCPSPKVHLNSSMMVGFGLVEDLASKFTDSPAFMVSRSELRLAFGLPGPIPPQPESDDDNSSMHISNECLRHLFSIVRESNGPS